jgi:agmatinase
MGLTLQNCDARYLDAAVVLFGAPYDGTASFRPGSRFGPAAMRQDGPSMETYSPYLDQEWLPHKTADIGDLDLPPGGRQNTLERIGETVTRILADGKKPFMIGGEHLVTLPAVDACWRRWPDLAVLHLDAHADLRESYLGERLSHATVMRRIWDITGDGSIWQLGIRSGTAEEFAFAREGHVCQYRFDLDGMTAFVEAIGSRPLYLSIDLDVLDPSCFPGTGTPEPGGPPFTALLAALAHLAGSRIVGADLVELAPPLDPSGISTAAALKALRELMILL